ncbi:hypothetical protein L6R52_14655 [Myxococcota bacterium]|nr:hypothetical protein [Myxococcota bacterium]
MNLARRLKTLFAAAALGLSALALAAPAQAAEPNKGTLVGYVWAENPKAAAAYTPSAAYQFNATKAVNAVTRTGTGTYTVKFTGLKSTGGHAQVTSYGAGPNYCKIVSWNPAGADQNVNVACYDANGAPADAQFALAFYH